MEKETREVDELECVNKLLNKVESTHRCCSLVIETLVEHFLLDFSLFFSRRDETRINPPINDFLSPLPFSPPLLPSLFSLFPLFSSTNGGNQRINGLLLLHLHHHLVAHWHIHHDTSTSTLILFFSRQFSSSSSSSSVSQREREKRKEKSRCSSSFLIKFIDVQLPIREKNSLNISFFFFFLSFSAFFFLVVKSI